MTEYVHPDNPFPVSQNFKEITPALISSAIETLAFISVPASDPDDVPAHLIAAVATEWTRRMTGFGAELTSYAVVWELAAMVTRCMSTGIQFPPFDITTRCGDKGCQEDHGRGRARLVNDLFEAGRTGQHRAAVKAFAALVHAGDPVLRPETRERLVAALLVHMAERVSQHRSGSVEELPSLG